MSSWLTEADTSYIVTNTLCKVTYATFFCVEMQLHVSSREAYRKCGNRLLFLAFGWLPSYQLYLTTSIQVLFIQGTVFRHYFLECPFFFLFLFILSFFLIFQLLISISGFLLLLASCSLRASCPLQS